MTMRSSCLCQRKQSQRLRNRKRKTRSLRRERRAKHFLMTKQIWRMKMSSQKSFWSRILHLSALLMRSESFSSHLVTSRKYDCQRRWILKTIVGSVLWSLRPKTKLDWPSRNLNIRICTIASLSLSMQSQATLLTRKLLQPKKPKSEFTFLHL